MLKLGLWLAARSCRQRVMVRVRARVRVRVRVIVGVGVGIGVTVRIKVRVSSAKVSPEGVECPALRHQIGRRRGTGLAHVKAGDWGLG